MRTSSRRPGSLETRALSRTDPPGTGSTSRPERTSVELLDVRFFGGYLCRWLNANRAPECIQIKPGRDPLSISCCLPTVIQTTTSTCGNISSGFMSAVQSVHQTSCYRSHINIIYHHPAVCLVTRRHLVLAPPLNAPEALEPTNTESSSWTLRSALTQRAHLLTVTMCRC